MGLGADLFGSFVLGLLTPLTAVCVLPLYPGFLAYLSNQAAPEDGPSVAALGALVAAGTVGFMFLFGLAFSTVLEVSLTRVIEVVSPVAFVALAGLSVLLIFDADFERLLPAVEPPQSKHPVASALGYGFFFGAIVVPCNPAFIALFFARSFLFTDPVVNLLNFLSFGGGIAAPLLAFAVASEPWSHRVIGTLTRYRTPINRLSGGVMLVVSLYYLVVVFDVFGSVV